MEILLYLIITMLIIFIYVLFKYNSLVAKKNKIMQSKSGIDVYLTQRFELIPNLVECVKGYMSYEMEIFKEITEQRTKYFENRNLKDGERLDRKCKKLIASAEKYPDIKASEQFLNLQKNLSKIESQLQASRRIYNVDVNIYNTTIEKFPGNIIAKIFNFTTEDYFEAEEQAKDNTDVKL